MRWLGMLMVAACLASAPLLASAQSSARWGLTAEQVQADDCETLLRRAGGPAQAPSFAQAASRNDSMAMLLLAFASNPNCGGTNDLPTSASWLERAAALGNPRAMDNLGRLLMEGRGRPRDMAAAVVWYRRAAGAGSQRGAHDLAIAYANGDGVLRSFADARRWAQRAEALGDRTAQQLFAQIDGLERRQNNNSCQQQCSTRGGSWTDCQRQCQY